MENSEQPQESFTCSQCGFSFCDESHLLRHTSKFHNSRRKPNDLVIQSFECLICAKVCQSFVALLNHDLSKYKQTQTKVYCVICEKWDVTSPDNMLYHYQTSHHTELKILEEIKPYIRWRNFGDSSASFQCLICFNELMTYTQLTGHFITLHGVDFSTIFSADQNYFCEYCGAGFQQADDMVLHIVRTHWNSSQKSCIKCNKGFGSVCAARKHFRSYRCPTLRNELDNLGAEVRTDLYRGVKTFKCKECNFVGDSAHHLNIHKRKHTGEKPYKCHLCEKAFKQLGNFNTHLKLIHGEINRKQTPQREYRHPCKECGRKFITIADLKAHERIHTGEKPYSCPHCNRGFAQKGNYNIHLKRWHSGIKNVPIGSEPTFKVNKTKVGSDSASAEFNIFCFTVPLSKEKTIDNTCNSETTDKNKKDPSTDYFYTKFKTEKPKVTPVIQQDYTNSMALQTQEEQLALVPSDDHDSQNRAIYLPLYVNEISSEFCIDSTDRDESSNSSHVINHTVITSLNNLTQSHHSHSEEHTPNVQEPPVYTGVIENTFLSSENTPPEHYNILSTPVDESNESSPDISQATTVITFVNDHHHENHEYHDNQVAKDVTIPVITSVKSEDFLRFDDTSDKSVGLSPMDVNELFDSTLTTEDSTSRVDLQSDVQDMRIPEYSKTLNSISCIPSEDFYSNDNLVNWWQLTTANTASTCNKINEDGIDSNDDVNNFFSSNNESNNSDNYNTDLNNTVVNKTNLNSQQTVIKNVSGGEIRDVDTLDLSFNRRLLGRKVSECSF